MKIAVGELKTFWDSELGDQWVFQEGGENWVGNEPDHAVIELEDFATVMKEDSSPVVLDLCSLISEWRMGQPTTVLIVEVRVGDLDEVKDALAPFDVSCL